MEWLNDFYSKQLQWSMKYTNFNMEDLMEELADKMESFSDFPPKKILELGGGNGQFSVTAAKRGYDVTMIELTSVAVELTNKLAEKYKIGSNLRVIQGDFYEVELQDRFDVICYWDGFGIGSDSDQQKLLERIDDWLAPNGTVLMDIYTPWFWHKVAGQKKQFNKIHTKYDFDADACRMIDTWWIKDDKEAKITQSLRCYSPADLRLLLKGTGLDLVHCEPGGAMDYDKWQYKEQVPLNEAMTYIAKLKEISDN